MRGPLSSGVMVVPPLVVRRMVPVAPTRLSAAAGLCEPALSAVLTPDETALQLAPPLVVWTSAPFWPKAHASLALTTAQPVSAELVPLVVAAAKPPPAVVIVLVQAIVPPLPTTMYV